MKPTGLITVVCAVSALALTVSLQLGCTSHPAAHPAAPPAQKAEKPVPPPPRAGLFESKDIAKDVYIYGFPMIANYKTMFEFTVDTASPQFKAHFNQIWRDAEVFTPNDTVVATPNTDTLYSALEMDLRAEPLVLSVPEVEAGRYYSVQLIDMYTFNYGYIGSRATGNGAGLYLVAGPTWRGEVPAGIKGVFHCESQFSLAIYRTQLLNPGDIENVKKVQAGYKVQTLSAHLKKPAPALSPALHWPTFRMNSYKEDFFGTLNFLLQFCPPVPAEAQQRAAFAEIGVAPGQPFDFEKLDLERKLAVGLGLEAGYAELEKARQSIGEDENGWLLASSFGDREFYQGDWLLRGAAALAGIYGNDYAEAMYPIAYNDSEGRTLDGHHHQYALTFRDGQLPPVNAFWSVTMYDRRSQLLVTNSINRYVVNSPMVPNLQKNADGSLTLYIQNQSPGPEKGSNWLPAPDDDFYLVMRLYWPKEAALKGDWKPPGVERVK
jgi:hypothetical protein